MPYDKIAITLPHELIAELDARRDNTSGSIRIALERYLEVLRWERLGLRKLLSDAEMGLILDTLNGTAMLDSGSVGFIPHEVADAISLDELDQKWKVDGPALVQKLAAMSYAQKAALADAVERWWTRVGNGEQPEYGEALK